MKNTMKFFGIIVIITLIGFSMTACDDGTCKHHGSNARITIDGLSAYNGNFAFLSLGDTEFWGSGNVNSGSVTVDILCWECDQPDFRPGSYMVVLVIYNSVLDTTEKYSGFILTRVISAGNSSLNLSDFTQL